MGDLGGVSVPWEGELTPEEKQMGMLTHLLGIVGFIGPLVIMLINSGKSEYVRVQTMQSLYFQLFWLVVYIVLMVVSMVTCGFGAILYLHALAGWILYLIVGTMKANEGLVYKYPITGNMVK